MFVSNLAALLQKLVSVTIIDLVTIRNFNLYRELLEQIDRVDPSWRPESPSIYAASWQTFVKALALFQ